MRLRDIPAEIALFIAAYPLSVMFWLADREAAREAKRESKKAIAALAEARNGHRDETR